MTSDETQPDSTDSTDSTDAFDTAAASEVREEDGIPWGLVAFLILAVLLAVFTVQNTQSVALNYMSWSGEFPLIMIIVGVFVVGVILDEILGTVLRRRRRRRKAEKAELAELRKRK